MECFVRYVQSRDREWLVCMRKKRIDNVKDRRIDLILLFFYGKGVNDEVTGYTVCRFKI